MCRGFYDRYDTQALQLARRLWGIVEVPPPATAATGQPQPTSAEAAEATSAAPLRQPPTTHPGPLTFIDVDGVLNPDGCRQEALGYRPHRFDGTGPNGQPAGGTVWLHPDHGAWLAELEAAGGQPVWATSWGELANTWIAPRLGLPGTWPVVDLQGRGGVRWGHALKLDPITRYAAQRPFALVDDLMWAVCVATGDRHNLATLLVTLGMLEPQGVADGRVRLLGHGVSSSSISTKFRSGESPSTGRS